MSCAVGCRHGLDLVLLWLWCRLAAIALIRPLAWELPYAAGVALEKTKTKKPSDCEQEYCGKFQSLVLKGKSRPSASIFSLPAGWNVDVMLGARAPILSHELRARCYRGRDMVLGDYEDSHTTYPHFYKGEKHTSILLKPQ